VQGGEKDTIKAGWQALWQAKASRDGAFFHVASLFIVTVGLVTAQTADGYLRGRGLRVPTGLDRWYDRMGSEDALPG